MVLIDFTKDINSNVIEKNESKVLRQFKLPSIKSIFECSPNKYMEHAKIQDWIQEMFECSNMSKEKFKKVRSTWAVAPWFHHHTTSLKRFENVLKLFMTFYIFDDHTETEWGDVARDPVMCDRIWDQFDAVLEQLMYPDQFVNKGNWKPYTFMAYAVNESIWHGLNDVQRARFFRNNKDYIEGNRKETNLINDLQICDNFVDFFKLRLSSVNICNAIQLIEYCSDIFVPDKDWNYPAMQELMKLAEISILYIHDIYSFEKEYAENHGNLKNMINSVAGIAVYENCTIGEAMVRAGKHVEEYERQTMALMNHLLRDDFLCEESKVFINELNYMIGGNAYMHTIVAGCKTPSFMQKYDKALVCFTSMFGDEVKPILDTKSKSVDLCLRKVDYMLEQFERSRQHETANIKRCLDRVGHIPREEVEKCL